MFFWVPRGFLPGGDRWRRENEGDCQERYESLITDHLRPATDKSAGGERGSFDLQRLLDQKEGPGKTWEITFQG